MGGIEAAIVLESWVFGFRPCSGQGQFTLSISRKKGTLHFLFLLAFILGKFGTFFLI